MVRPNNDVAKCQCQNYYEEIKHLERKLTEEAYTVSILLEALECIIDEKDPNDPIKIAQETLEAYAARKGG